jgi:uncharacterized protein
MDEVYYPRRMDAALRRAATEFPVVLVTGARQVGKSTLIMTAFTDAYYVSMDHISEARQLEEDPRLFFARHGKTLLLDEIQYAPSAFRHLKARVDEDRHVMGQYILTGSQKFQLMKGVTESLAGRVAILELEGLSVRELGLKGKVDWPEALAKGGYPELWRKPGMDLNRYFGSYIATYVDRDVAGIIDVRNRRDFDRFLSACAARSGGVLNMSDLARDVAISHETARQWIHVLEATNQITLLAPYFETLGGRLTKAPKLYMNDTGLMCHLLGFDENVLARSHYAGAVWETFVFGELRKRIAEAGKPRKLYYYRDKNKLEVDFLEVGGGEIQLYEAKFTEAVEDNSVSKAFTPMRRVAEVLEKSRVNRVGGMNVVCRTEVPYLRQGVKITNPVEM